MSGFQTGTACMQKPDPLKRMNYTFGMVLGVDEFRQEQAYLVAKYASQYRYAHGYGTLSGLRVTIDTSPNLQVRITKGVAVNPRGQEIHVCQEMCARINDWLVNNRTALQDLLGSPPLSLSLSVVLCYRACPTDSVPVPGNPCSSQQDAMAPSHITDSFQLKLCLDSNQPVSPAIGSPSLPASDLCFRPEQLEEEATSAFGSLLRRIRVTDVSASSISQKDLVDMVRQLAAGPAPVTSPPSSAPIHLYIDDAPAFLRAAFLVWITEVRPTFQAQSSGCGCGCDAPAEDCVLLAELRFDVVAGWQVSGDVTVDESRRPYLIETRLLQESLWSGATGGGSGAGAVSAPAVVAAGSFTISGTSVSAAGPVLNGLQALPQATAGQYLLTWTGFPAYTIPTGSPSNAHDYVVKGTALAGLAASSPYVVQVLSYQNSGILIGVQGTRGTDPAAGFSVEISEVTGGFA